MNNAEHDESGGVTLTVMTEAEVRTAIQAWVTSHS
jgi:hypothetical protein